MPARASFRFATPAGKSSAWLAISSMMLRKSMIGMWRYIRGQPASSQFYRRESRLDRSRDFSAAAAVRRRSYRWGLSVAGRCATCAAPVSSSNVRRPASSIPTGRDPRNRRHGGSRRPPLQPAPRGPGRLHRGSRQPAARFPPPFLDDRGYAHYVHFALKKLEKRGTEVLYEYSP